MQKKISYESMVYDDDRKMVERSVAECLSKEMPHDKIIFRTELEFGVHESEVVEIIARLESEVKQNAMERKISEQNYILISMGRISVAIEEIREIRNGSTDQQHAFWLHYDEEELSAIANKLELMVESMNSEQESGQ